MYFPTCIFERILLLWLLLLWWLCCCNEILYNTIVNVIKNFIKLLLFCFRLYLMWKRYGEIVSIGSLILGPDLSWVFWVETFLLGILVVTQEGTIFLMWLANIWSGILALIGCIMSRSYKEEQDERVGLVPIVDCIIWSLIVENIISILVLVKPAFLTYNHFLYIL